MGRLTPSYYAQLLMSKANVEDIEHQRMIEDSIENCERIAAAKKRLKLPYKALRRDYGMER